MRSQPLPAAYCRSAVSNDAAASSRYPACRRAAVCHRAAVCRRTAVYSRSVARCQPTVCECAAVSCRLAVSCRPARGCHSTVYPYLTTHQTANMQPPSPLVQSSKQVRFIPTLLNQTMIPVNCRTTRQERVTYLDSGELGAAAAQTRGRLTGKPDRCGCPAGGTADKCEGIAALERKKGTRVPPSQGASEAAVQRTGGRAHSSDDKPDALRKWSGVAEK